MPEGTILKPVVFRGDSLDRLRAFPRAARRETGFQLDRDAAGAFRAVYVAHLANAVYVLHCFQKKSGKTGKADLKLARTRYRDLMRIVK